MEPRLSFWFEQEIFGWSLAYSFGLNRRFLDGALPILLVRTGEALPTFFELRTRNDDEALPNFLD
jgi:hypothetical protein